jgi:CDP-diacylglycerol--glycerol-3-phosphate 3-phosphatidyltransferase
MKNNGADNKTSAWNAANALTFARVMMIPAFIVLFMWGALPGNRLFALAVFAAACLTDALDGYVARKRKLITNLGKFMDPLADKLLVAAALIMLTETGELPGWAVVVILSREFIVTGFRTVAAGRGTVIAAGVLGKIKTVSQMVMLFAFIPRVSDYTAAGWLSGLQTALFAVAVVMTVVSGTEYIYKNIGVLGESD